MNEAARRAGISVAWMRRLCADGRVEGARKIGRDWLIPEGAQVEELPPRPPRALRITEIPRAKKRPRR